jgi:hypothetical protein
MSGIVVDGSCGQGETTLHPALGSRAGRTPKAHDQPFRPLDAGLVGVRTARLTNHDIFRFLDFLFHPITYEHASGAPFRGDALPTRIIGGRAPAATSTVAPMPASANKQFAQVGRSMVAALVNSPLNVRPGAAPAGFTRFWAVYPATAPALQPRRFRCSRRSLGLSAGQRSTRFFALIELDVHRPKHRSYFPFHTRRRYFPPSTPRFSFWPPASNSAA